MNRSEFENSPTGTLVPTILGESAFVPTPLPPPDLDLSPVLPELSDASQMLGELNGIGRTLDNPMLLIRPLQTKEALTSSSMEGTFTTVDELLLLDAGFDVDQRSETLEVLNYRHALLDALDSLPKLPLCLRTIRDAHATLLRGVGKARGSNVRPGEFKRDQNWIGAPTIDRARFVPPPPAESEQAMNALEGYIQRTDRGRIPPLIDAALVHYQFEAIHPFPDGNGRVGRILIPLLLHERGVLPRPLLYVSPYLEQNKDRYIDLMYEVSRSGDWIGWIGFFLQSVSESARRAIRIADRLLHMRADYRERLQQARRSALLTAIADYVFSRPVFSIPQIAGHLDITYAAAQRNVAIVVAAGIVEEIAQTSYPKYFAAREVMRAIEES